MTKDLHVTGKVFSKMLVIFLRNCDFFERLVIFWRDCKYNTHAVHSHMLSLVSSVQFSRSVVSDSL